MTRILLINSPAARTESASVPLTRQIVERFAALEDVEVLMRDVGSEPLPHLTPATIKGMRGEPATPAEQATRVISEQLIAEPSATDIIIIGAPMHNFGIPLTLKAWLDHALRAGVTFRYTAKGPEGLLKGKRAIVVEPVAGFTATVRRRRWTPRNRTCERC